jgi:hypothetical protein
MLYQMNMNIILIQLKFNQAFDYKPVTYQEGIKQTLDYYVKRSNFGAAGQDKSYSWSYSLKKENRPGPDPLEMESLRIQLYEKTLKTHSNSRRLVLYQEFIDLLLNTPSSVLSEAYIPEFLEEYIYLVCRFNVWGTEPEYSVNLLHQLRRITAIKAASEHLDKINSEITRIEKQYESLISVLVGEKQNETLDKAYFPLIDNEAPGGFYGIVESLTVRISRSAEQDKFILIPSGEDIEKKYL